MKVDFETLDALERVLFALEKAKFSAGELCEELGTTAEINNNTKDRLELLSNIVWDYVVEAHKELSETISRAKLIKEV